MIGTTVVVAVFGVVYPFPVICVSCCEKGTDVLMTVTPSHPSFRVSVAVPEHCFSEMIVFVFHFNILVSAAA